MDQEDKLSILKQILLTDDRELASSIEQKIKTLEDTINKKDNLSEKVDPIINDKLNEFVQEMPQTLGPTITEVLKEEIKNSQDAVVEALFPIIGKMIKKYIQQEMRILSENINKQVNSAFSFKGLRRKLKSRATGVSEADLLIQDQLNPVVEQLMVIEKGSGILISEYSRTQDMVAGMLTAIKSFAEDAFDVQNQEIQNIEYDLYHIHIQNFSSYYIAVVISGTYNVIFKGLLEDKLLDFAQNIINKEDIEDEQSLTRKLKEYFKDEDF